MKKLIITHKDHGHIEVTDAKEIDTEFRKIMEAGYGGKVPAVFIADRVDGTVTRHGGKDAESLLGDPGVNEVTVIVPLEGG